jgi:Xaa-Pro aminopeptidase
MPEPDHPHRLERLRSWMADLKLDCLVATGSDNVTYLAEYTRRNGSCAAVVVGPQGERTIVVGANESDAARKLGRAEAIHTYGTSGIGAGASPDAELAEAVESLVLVRHARRLGIADDTGALAKRLSSKEIVSASEAIAALRRQKDPDELLRILHSYELCWLGQLQIARVADEGGSEIEAYSAAEAVAQIAHGSPIEFNSDLLSGPNTGLASSPSHIPGGRAVQRGDPVLADVALRADGYWGDTAETHVVGQQQEIADVRVELLGILSDVGSELKPALPAAELYATVHRRILAQFPDGDFPHHAGHGLGLEFERPFLVPWELAELESSMVIALEPGVYFPGRWGVRVENLFVVTPSGGVELREAMGVRV